MTSILNLVNGPEQGPLSIYKTIVATLPTGSAEKHVAFVSARTEMVRMGVKYLAACALLNAAYRETR